jgi:hypothetical protein
MYRVLYSYRPLLTFVLVGLGLDTENGDHSDDDDNGCCGQSHHKPGHSRGLESFPIGG